MGRHQTYTQWREVDGGGGKVVEFTSGSGSTPALNVHFTDCFILRFPSSAQASLAHDGILTPPPLYGDDVSGVTICDFRNTAYVPNALLGQDAKLSGGDAHAYPQCSLDATAVEPQVGASSC